MDPLIELFTDTHIGSLNLIIFGFFIGACLAGFATVYHRRTVGSLIRYLLDAQAFSPESARTLREAEQDLNIFVRTNLRRNVAFRRLVCMAEPAEDTQTSDPKKKQNLSDIPLYINPNERMRAEEMYSSKTSQDANMWMVLLSIAVFAVVAYGSAFIIPKLVAMLTNFIASL